MGILTTQQTESLNRICDYYMSDARHCAHEYIIANIIANNIADDKIYELTDDEFYNQYNDNRNQCIWFDLYRLSLDSAIDNEEKLTNVVRKATELAHNSLCDELDLATYDVESIYKSDDEVEVGELQYTGNAQAIFDRWFDYYYNILNN